MRYKWIQRIRGFTDDLREGFMVIKRRQPSGYMNDDGKLSDEYVGVPYITAMDGRLLLPTNIRVCVKEVGIDPKKRTYYFGVSDAFDESNKSQHYGGSFISHMNDCPDCAESFSAEQDQDSHCLPVGSGAEVDDDLQWLKGV